MSYKSKPQQRYFDYLESKGKLPKKNVDEFDEYEDSHDTPEDIEKYSAGGMVDSDDVSGEDNFDYDVGHESEYDSSGEPHTEDELEDEHPMELMNKGGIFKKMSKPSMAPSRGFVKALRRMR